MKKKIYKIRVKGGGIGPILDELQAWNIPSTEFAVQQYAIFTSNRNVVDVAVEVFIHKKDQLNITWKYADSTL